MDIHLETLGPPNLRTPEGEVVDFPVGKPLALLIYLVVEGKPVSRDDLARLLWPGSTPARARHSVRQAIWLLRRNLGEDVVEGEESVWASATTLSSDLAAFHEALSAGDVEAARGFWRGPFLKGLSLTECREWELWREDQREALKRRFFVALLDQARRTKREGEERDALSYLDQASRLNPHSKEVAVLRIEALLATGRIPAARQALEEAKRIQEDLGGPAEELASLQAAFREIDRRPDSIVPERVGESVEFVGRSSELAKLRALWREVLDGRPRSACILGPTGIGKTRLAEEFLSGVEASGGRVARAKGYRNEQRISRGTVTDLVRQLLGLPGAKGISSGSEAVLRAVLPTLLLKANGHEPGDRELPRVEEVSAATLADAVADLVEAVGFEVSLVLFLDDWQWADKESRALLGKVMRRVRGLPCLFLLAERTGEHSLRQERAEGVIRDLGGPRIPLGALTEPELAELMGLLAVFTDPEAGEELVRRIHRVTGGNPLFVGELLRKLGEDGVYRRQGDRWILAVDEVPVDLDLPESIQELIRARLERLTPTAAHVAGVLAAQDRSATVRLLRRRSGLDEAVLTRAVGELADREVVAWVGPQELEFAHDQLREAAGLYFQPGRRGSLGRWIGERPGWVGLGLLTGIAVVVLVLSGGSSMIGSAREATYPFGEGSLLMVGTRSALEYRPPRREGESWVSPEAPIPLPPTPFRSTVRGAFRAPDGELRWFGNAMPGQQTTPYAVEMLGGGRERVLLQTEGDDGFEDIAPCGRQAMVVSENLATEFYDYDLLLLDLDNETSRRIYRARERINFAMWSPDGQRIAAGIRAKSDTVALLSPQGEVLDRVAFPEYRGVLSASWCADNRTLLLHVASEEGRRGVLLDTSDGSRRELPGDFAPNGGPLCLGPARGAVGVMAEGAGRTLRFFDLVSGESEEIPSDFPINEMVHLLWIPDDPVPPVYRIRIFHPLEVLPWGARDTLGTEGIRRDESTERVESVWTSSDPSVVSVQPGGILSANKAGRAWIIATYRDWLRDSVEVRVEDSEFNTEDVLFRADFSNPALPDWNLYGDPLPSVEEQEGEWVLSLNGDGRYQDGVNTNATFPMGQGGTLEFEFRLRLGRTDRQRIGACLWEDAPGSTDPAGIPISPLNRFCFHYPSGEQLKFREDLGLVVSGPLSGDQEFSVAPALPSDDWVHIALQVRADGATSLFLNRQLAVRPSTRLRLDTGREWVIRIYGASVDTHLWVRNLTLWRGERYDATRPPTSSALPEGPSTSEETGQSPDQGSP